MQDLSLHILDIAENAARAQAETIHIRIEEDDEHDRLTVCIADDGKGMDSETSQKVIDPFFTTKKGKRVGLGLSLLSLAAQQTGGDVTINSKNGEGTAVTASFIPSHVDMKPTGDIFVTLMSLIAGFPKIRFIYDYKKGDEIIHYDTRE